MNEKKALFIINILKNIIGVYFDTFFVFYFFKVANYEVLPLVKYYLTLYLFIGIGFFLIRSAMKKKIRAPYFRIGISMQALYIALIMLLKDNIIHHIFLVGIVKGIADGFYHFPKNIMNTDIISNESRQKYDGIVNTVNKIMSIIIPLLLGILLTYFSYTNLGKVFFILFIVMFIVSFYIKDVDYVDEKFETKKFMKLIKANKNVKFALLLPFLAGFTYSSGVMGTVVTLSKINVFKTNLNLGFVDSACAVISLLTVILLTSMIKKKHFKLVSIISGVVSFITLVIFAFIPSTTPLIVYLFVRNSCITSISVIAAIITSNFSNTKELKETFKTEFFFAREVMFSISRCSGYIILLIICLFVGIKYINYILIMAGFAILIQTILMAKLSSVEE